MVDLFLLPSALFLLLRQLLNMRTCDLFSLAVDPKCRMQNRGLGFKEYRVSGTPFVGKSFFSRLFHPLFFSACGFVSFFPLLSPPLFF